MFFRSIFKTSHAFWLRQATAVACLGGMALGSAYAQSDTVGCVYKPEVLSKALGGNFQAGVPEQGMGKACVYKGTIGKDSVTFWIGFIPASGPFETMRMFIGPRSIQFTPQKGDPDQAMTVTAAPGVPTNPHIVYMRGGHMVHAHLTGVLIGKEGAERAKVIEGYNGKLLGLPRAP
jgi:hypothetical protein